MSNRVRLLPLLALALTAFATAPAVADEPQKHAPPKAAPHPRGVRPGAPVNPGMRGNFAHPHGAMPYPGFAHTPAIRPGGFPRPDRAFAGRSDFRGRLDFRSRDIRTFQPHERTPWRTGRWYRQWHDGRFGWWWVVDGGWYFYPQPVYPYPAYASTDADVGEVPQFEPEAGAVPVGPPPMQYWYYCNNPPGYYPDIPNCWTPWRPVPATPSP